MNSFFKRLWSDESGQALTEYALILAVLAVAVIGVMLTMGGKFNEVFTRISESINVESSQSGS